MIPLINRNTSLTGFMNNRVKRLYPALLMFVFLYAALGYLFLLDDEYVVLLESSIGSLWHIQNVLESSKEGYFVDTNGFRPFLNAWSLAVEFQVYLILGFVLLVLCKNQRLSDQVKFIFILFSISIAGYMVSSYSYKYDPFFISPLRLWEFLVGSLLFYLMKSSYATEALGFLKKFKLSHIALIIIGLFIYLNGGQLKGLSTILSVLFCALFIFSVDLSKLHRFVRKSYVYVGSISYSVYLFHYPAIEFLERFVGSPSVLDRVAVIFCVFLVSHVVDLWITPKIISLNRAGVKLLLGSCVLSAVIILLYVNLDVLSRGVVTKNEIINVSDSFEVNYNENCVFLSESGTYEDERCRIGSGLNNIDEPNFIIIGDSLSNSMTTMFESLAKIDYKFSEFIQIGKGYCPIVFDFGDEECKKFKRDAISFLNDHKGKTIVIATQWPLYFYENDVDTLDRRKRELIEFIRKYKDYGSSIYLSHSVPLGAKPRSCLARFPWSSLGGCDIPHATFSKRGEFAYSVLETIAEESNVSIFDPAKYMCDLNTCAVFSDGEIFYLDDSHFSENGGRYLAEKSMGWWYDNFK
jgi:peptidoglycan/LPS O-acetylase OafA/YrhL